MDNKEKQMKKIKLALSAAVMALAGLVSAPLAQAAAPVEPIPVKNGPETGVLKVSRLAQSSIDFREMPSN
jgi:hypothetical protein